MKLGDFLAAPGGVRQAATRTLDVRVVGKDLATAADVVGQTKVDIAFVSEKGRQEALRDAEKVIREAYPNGDPPDVPAENERKYHVLLRALRDHDDPRSPWASNVTELKNALVLAEANRIWMAYLQFMEEEFPDAIDAETFEKLMEEAKKASLPDLITSFGYDAVRRSIPGLLVFLKP